MTTYKCFKSDFEGLIKKINRITKKLDKYGYKWHFEVIGESIEEVNVIDYTNYNNIPAWQFIPKNCGKIAVDVISYTFEMDVLKLGEYEVIAVLEHTAIEGSNENLIHIIKEGSTIPLHYRTVKSICEHCNSNRQRNKTVLLQDTAGNIKQVGTTCIHEYTGIDGLDIIAAYQDIRDIIINNNRLYVDYARIGNYTKYNKTIDYLAACIQLIKEKGYKKDETKHKAWEITGTNYQDKKYFDIAQKVIDYFKNTTFGESQDFLNNIKLYVSQEYTKVSGFIAYAYIAYQKQLEYEAKKAAEKAKESQHIGKVGDRITVQVHSVVCLTSWETEWGIIRVYKIVDVNGNVYTWKTSSFIAEDEVKNIKGTVKEHKEFRGIKQTELTRCKVS